MNVIKITPLRSGSSPDAAEPNPRTRDALLRLMVDCGPVTASVLADRLGLTGPAVRRHLEALLAEGLITAADSPVTGLSRGRGRPAKRYSLTPLGHDGIGSAYDTLAGDALRFLARTAGPGAVRDFANSRAAALEARYADALKEQPVDARPGVLADLLREDGYAAAVSEDRELEVCQHHCPVASVAGEFPEICEAETEMFGRLLQRDVSRKSTIAAGNVSCITYVAPVTAIQPQPIQPRTRQPGTSQPGTSQTSDVNRQETP